MSDSEYESSGPVQCERAKPKQVKESVKRKSSACDSEYESSGPVQCERAKPKQVKESVKRKSSACDSEYESSGPVQRERVKPKQVKESVKRKTSANRSVPTDRSRTNKKKAPAPSFDVFNLQEGELPTDRDRKSSATSVLYNRVANGQTRRTAHLDGSFYIELKVFDSEDVDAGGDDLWKKSLLWLKLRTNNDTPHWDHVQKFVRQASSLFESEPTFYSNNIKFK